MAENKLEDFLSSPLVAWVRTYEDRYVCDTVEALSDGVLLTEIMQQIYPGANVSMVNQEVNGDANLRAQNLTVLMTAIRQFFGTYLQQLIVMQLPDIMAIAYEPKSDHSLDQLEKILLLMLGCAVQCESKEKLIENIKKMTNTLQGSLVVHIQEVTHNPDNVYSMDFDTLGGLNKKDLETECQNAFIRLKRVTRERDNYYASFSEAAQEKNHLRRELLQNSTRGPSSPMHNAVSRGSFASDMANAGLIASQAEVTELRAKLRDLTDQLDLKTLSVSESHKELIMLQEKITKMQQEKHRMLEEVQWSRDHHDELDSLRMKARRIDQLETENSKYRRKLEDMEHVTRLIKEVKNEKQLLTDGNKSLQAEVDRLNSRFSSLDDVEMENAQLRQQVRALTEAKESDMEQLQMLMEQNARLELNSNQDAEHIEELRQELNEVRFATPAGSVTPSLATADFNFSLAGQEKPVAEALQSRLIALERDNKELDRVTAELREAKARVTTLEAQSKSVQSQRFSEQKEIAIAREELKREREKVKQAEEAKSKVKEDLQRGFAQREHALQGRVIEEKRKYLEVEQKLDDEAQRRAEVAQDRIANLEARLDLSEKEKLQLRNDLTSALEEMAVVSVKLVNVKEELRAGSDKLGTAEEEVAVTNDRLRQATDQLEEEKRRVQKLEHQQENERNRVESLSKLLKEEKVQCGMLDKSQSELKQQNVQLREQLTEEKEAAEGLKQKQEEVLRRAENSELHLAEEKSRADQLLEKQQEQQARIDEQRRQQEVAAEKPTEQVTAPPPVMTTSCGTQTPDNGAESPKEEVNSSVQAVETVEAGVQTEVELWLEQVVALAQAQGFLGGPVEEQLAETEAKNEAENSTLQPADSTQDNNEVADTQPKPMQAVAPVKSEIGSPITPAFVASEIAKAATVINVKAAKAITPRAAASMLLSSSPALSRAVSSLISSPGSSPLLSRSVIANSSMGKSPGVQIMPAVVGVMESIRGVMETAGTPTLQHKTMGSERQQVAAGVQKTLNFARSGSPSLEPAADNDHSTDPLKNNDQGDAGSSYDPAGLREELRRIKQEYSALESQLNTIKRQYQGETADLESELRNLRRQLHGSKMQISELNDELARVRKQLRTAHQQNSSMEDELNHVRHQVHSTRQQWQEARGQLQSAGGQLQVAQMTNHQLETHSAQIEAANEALSNRCDALEQLSNNMSEETRNLYSEVKKLLMENRDLRMKNDQAKDKYIEDEKSYADRLAELEHERGRLNSQLDTMKKTKKKRFALGKIGTLGKKAKHLLGGEKDRHQGAGKTATDGYDSASSGSSAPSVPQSVSMPRIVGRDRGDTLPSITNSGSIESFGGSNVQLAGVRKTRSVASSLNDADTIGSSHSQEEDDPALQLERLMSGLDRLNSPGMRASIATSSPAPRHRVGSEEMSLEDFLRETDKTPQSRRRLFNEVLVDTPPEKRKLSSNSPNIPSALAADIRPRREISNMDAPAFLDSLKSTPSRQTLPQEPFRRQRPIHQGRAMLRQGSSDSRASSQNSNETGAVPVERSASMSVSNQTQMLHAGSARRYTHSTSASSIESHGKSASPLASHSSFPPGSLGGGAGGITIGAATPPPPNGRNGRDSQSSLHQPLTRMKAVPPDSASIESNPSMEPGTGVGGGVVMRTSTPSSAGVGSSRFGDESDVMTALDAIMSGTSSLNTTTLPAEDDDIDGEITTTSYRIGDKITPSSSSPPTIIRELQQSPTRLSPAVRSRRNTGTSDAEAGGDLKQQQEDDGDGAGGTGGSGGPGAAVGSGDTSNWFEYGTV